jgi:hypothetical protein
MRYLNKFVEYIKESNGRKLWLRFSWEWVFGPYKQLGVRQILI